MPTINHNKKFILLLGILLAFTACSVPPKEPLPIAADAIVIPTRVTDNDPIPTLPVVVVDVSANELEGGTAVPTAVTISYDVTPTATASPCTPNSDWPRYMIQAGDTLFAIAQKVNTTVSDLQTANCLTDTLIRVNQELAVPQLPAADPEIPFETRLAVGPVEAFEASVQAVLLEPGQEVTIEWTPLGGWPQAADQANQLEFVYQPVDGFPVSLAIYQNIPAEAITLDWVAPEGVLGSLSTSFQWSGSENNAQVDHLSFVSIPQNSCYFSPFGIGGEVGIYRAADGNSSVIGETVMGELQPAIGQGGRWTIPQTGESGVFYLIEFTGGEGWVYSYRGALVGTACDQLAEIRVEDPVAMCERAWFFKAAPATSTPCPLEVRETWAAVQSFEQGTMFWLEEVGRYYILADTALPAAVLDTNYPLITTIDPLVATQDSSAEYTAPAGLYAPTSGFGLLWRGDVHVNLGDLITRLGWATAPEQGFLTQFQCDDAQPSGGQTWQSCYFAGPDGEIIHILPASYEQWRLAGR